MSDPIGGAGDQALQPAAAAARVVDAGMEATRRALDQQQVEGRDAVTETQAASSGSGAAPGPSAEAMRQPPDAQRGRNVDRVA
jgi:hypothetical protein